MSMEPKIALTGVHKSFGSKHVLSGVDLAVDAGKSLVIIGGSGTGKSVTLKCIIGLLQPDAGEIRIDGATMTSRLQAEMLDQFGMLFQGGALFDSLTVWENIAFRLRQGRGRLSRSAARDLAVEKLERVGLGADNADLFPSELSGGMQKRVGLARAIATDPKIIFFDEPTTGLDPILANRINELIRGIVTEIGATAVTITHDMTSVRAIADRVAMIQDGRIQWEGPVDDIDTTENGHVHQFINGLAEGPIPSVR